MNEADRHTLEQIAKENEEQGRRYGGRTMTLLDWPDGGTRGSYLHDADRAAHYARRTMLIRNLLGEDERRNLGTPLIG